VVSVHYTVFIVCLFIVSLHGLFISLQSEILFKFESHVTIS
jgi:ABC-type microcin C transport system permease subunit YejB